MFSLRQILRCGARLTLAREPINLHQILMFRKERSDFEKLCVRSLLHTKTDPCETPKENKNEDAEKKVLGKMEQKMKIMFTCKKCNYRNGKIISKLAYEKGVVIIRCDGCNNNHLIADNLGWFHELGNKPNIEKLLAKKGETIRKVRNDVEGYIEIVAKAEYDLIQHNKNVFKPVVQEKVETHVQYEKVGSKEET
ncbi:uncharacterized protein LOC108629328 [Ceratina calcarata]|uniref:Uncharacterized protein LOC108629328 n=1 Tax=Ceratina calcarata TaxID=156304 RepID=A0AAJ7S9C6_9HYME|nr:uncharacterized protein LOC108629328 [Ceratina calcarata]